MTVYVDSTAVVEEGETLQSGEAKIIDVDFNHIGVEAVEKTDAASLGRDTTGSNQKSFIPFGESRAVVSDRSLNGPMFDYRKNSGSTVDVSDLVDTSKTIEVEKIDLSTLPKKRVYFFLKRLFDILACSIALILLAIPMCVIAIAIKRDSPGPVFYKQERLGKNDKPFMLIKFRSMYTDAEAGGAQWAVGNDPRITLIGKKLRATRLDELPQFFQVVSGKIPQRILKTGQGGTFDSPSLFALPAKELRTKKALFPQVKVTSGTYLRTVRNFLENLTAAPVKSQAVFAKRVPGSNLNLMNPALAVSM